MTDQDEPVDNEPAENVSRGPGVPWWRLGVAAAALVGLVVATTAGDGALSLGAMPGTVDTGQVREEPSDGAFVDVADLACPGPEPFRTDQDEAPHVSVMAAGAPASVLDTVPPSQTYDGDQARTATAGPDAATQTVAPDAASQTVAPDASSQTVAPDASSQTVAPDASSQTVAPDASSQTVAPDAASQTVAPDAAEGAAGSVLRTTDGNDAASEPVHGIPVEIRLDDQVSGIVSAWGDMAPGLTGGQLGVGTAPGSRGLTLTSCVAAGEVQWLVGGGAQPGRSEQLVLTNPGPDAVTVDVAVWGAQGPVEAPGASGIVVPGDGRRVELLDALAPGAESPVVSVTATGGPVVAHLAESFRQGTTDRGAELVSPAAAPATDLVVPALPTAPDGHDHELVLRIVAPGDAQAVVDVTALTPDGGVRLADNVTRVPAGHTVDVELDGLPEGPVALRLRSDEPVTAGARLEVLPADGEPVVVTEPEDPLDSADPVEEPSTSQAEPLLRGAGELAWVGASVPSTTPAGMALPSRGAVQGGDAVLALTAVDGTTAWVTWVDEDGQESSRSVDLPNDTTVQLALPDTVRAVWVLGAGPPGLVSAIHVRGADDRGPYVASTSLPALPWKRQVTEVRSVVP